MMVSLEKPDQGHRDRCGTAYGADCRHQPRVVTRGEGLNHTMHQVSIPRRLSRRGSELTIFMAVVLVLGDLAVVVTDYLRHDLYLGRGPVCDVWDITKALAVAVGLFAIALRTRSLGISVFGCVFLLIGIEDQVAWHGIAAQYLVERVDLTAVAEMTGDTPESLGEFLILAALAVTALILVWIVPDRTPGFRRVRLILTIWLIVMSLSATVVDLVAANFEPASLWALLEESGERVVLSLIGAYVAGLLATMRASRSPGRPLPF
jgi:hypothetical protein